MYNFRSLLIALRLASTQRAGMTYHNAGMVTSRRSPTVGVGYASSCGQSYNGNHARHGGTHGSWRIRKSRGAA